jgi:predicted phosphodiesterase
MLERLTCENVFVIGNHDARNVGEVHFEEFFGSRRRELELPDMRLIGLDSSEPDLDSGRIGRETYRYINERFSIDPEEFTVVAMHHHLVAVPGTGRERNTVYDAGDMLRVLADCGVDLVLCGHKHVPNVWRLEDMLIINAGTCCTHRLRGKVRPAYNIIEITEDRSRVRVLRKEPFVDAEDCWRLPGHPSALLWLESRENAARSPAREACYRAHRRRALSACRPFRTSARLAAEYEVVAAVSRRTEDRCGAGFRRVRRAAGDRRLSRRRSRGACALRPGRGARPVRRAGLTSAQRFSLASIRSTRCRVPGR